MPSLFLETISVLHSDLYTGKSYVIFLLLGLILGYLFKDRKNSFIQINFYISLNSNNFNHNGNHNGNDNVNKNGNGNLSHNEGNEDNLKNNGNGNAHANNNDLNHNSNSDDGEKTV